MVREMRTFSYKRLGHRNKKRIVEHAERGDLVYIRAKRNGKVEVRVIDKSEGDVLRKTRDILCLFG